MQRSELEILGDPFDGFTSKSVFGASKKTCNKLDIDLMNYLATGAEPSRPRDRPDSRSLEDGSTAHAPIRVDLEDIATSTNTAPIQVELEDIATTTNTAPIQVELDDIATTTDTAPIQVELGHSASAAVPEENALTADIAAAVPVVDLVITETAAASTVMSAGVSCSGDPCVETGLQARSRRATVLKAYPSETNPGAGKNKTSLSSKNKSFTAARTPRVVLRERKSADQRKNDSVRKSSDASMTTRSILIYDDSESENDLPSSTARSNGQTKAAKRGVAKSIPRAMKKTAAGTDQQSKRKSGDTSVGVHSQNARSENHHHPKDTEVERNRKDTEVGRNHKDTEVERNRKNAEWARTNRLKQKVYVESLEQEVTSSRRKIGELEGVVSYMEGQQKDLEEEVHYLKSVLANQSKLAHLLKNIPNVRGVALSSSSSSSSSPVSRKRPWERSGGSDSCPSPGKKRGEKSPSGVCLHVDHDRVSLELCHHCAQMASATSNV